MSRQGVSGCTPPSSANDSIRYPAHLSARSRGPRLTARPATSPTSAGHPRYRPHSCHIEPPTNSPLAAKSPTRDVNIAGMYCGQIPSSDLMMRGKRRRYSNSGKSFGADRPPAITPSAASENRGRQRRVRRATMAA